MIPKTIKPESFYDVKINRLVVLETYKLSPRASLKVKGKVLSAILATNKDAVVEAVEV